MNHSTDFIEFADGMDLFLKQYGNNDIIRNYYGNYYEAKKHLKGMAKDARQAVKFKLPDNGQIIDLKGRESFKATYEPYVPVIKLPYDVVVLEFEYLSNIGVPTPMIVICKQLEDRIEFEAATDMSQVVPNYEGSIWVSTTRRPNVIKGQWDNLLLDFNQFEDEPNQDKKESLIKNELSYLYVMMEFLAAMSCQNISTVDEIPDKKMNEKRKKKKLTPFFTYKVLTVNTQLGTASEETGLGSSHASPRVHMRRGHIRRLKNKTVWVNQCIVGDKTKGVVVKDYNVV